MSSRQRLDTGKHNGGRPGRPVLQGETAVIHCMVGRHRAAGIATLARLVFTGETFEESAEWIGRRRNIDLQGLFRDYRVREFLYYMKSTSRMTAALPRVTGYAVTERSKVHLVTGECIPLCGGQHCWASGWLLLHGRLPRSSVIEQTALLCLCRACTSWCPEKSSGLAWPHTCWAWFVRSMVIWKTRRLTRLGGGVPSIAYFQSFPWLSSFFILFLGQCNPLSLGGS